MKRKVVSFRADTVREEGELAEQACNYIVKIQQIYYKFITGSLC